MSGEQGAGDGVVLAPVVPPAEVDEIAAVTNGVDELQHQVQQLQEQLQMAELLKQNLQIAASNEVENKDNSRVQQLEHELQLRTDERENYRNKLEAAEKRVVDLQLISTANLDDNNSQRGAVQETIEKMTVTLKEQTDQCEKFERQNTQLVSQVKALKEVIAVHKDLLAIRKLESDQLKTTIKLLEDHAKAEKDRRNAVLAKMECAVKLNGELKSEYENQLRIFQDLRDKYNLKIEILKNENVRLQALVPVEPLLLDEAAGADQDAVILMAPNEEPIAEQ